MAPPPHPSSSKSSSALATAGKKRALDEIDDLFAAKKSKPTASAPSSAPPTAGGELSKSQRKKLNKGKGKPVAEDEDAEMMDLDSAPVVSAAKRVPQTIVDSSASIEKFRAPPPAPTRKRKAGEGGAEGHKEADADDRFMDSRGTRESFPFCVLTCEQSSH